MQIRGGLTVWLPQVSKMKRTQPEFGDKILVIYKLRKTSTANVPLPQPNQEKTDY
jgi:hypothetical protein